MGRLWSVDDMVTCRLATVIGQCGGLQVLLSVLLKLLDYCCQVLLPCPHCWQRSRCAWPAGRWASTDGKTAYVGRGNAQVGQRIQVVQLNCSLEV